MKARSGEKNERSVDGSVLGPTSSAEGKGSDPLPPCPKDTLNWAVHRHLFYQDASDLRERFDANKHVQDLDTIDRMLAEGEATYNKWRHPDPYIVTWAPGGSKFTRNPTPPAGIEIVYDYG
ncbi:hypothetical protein SLE2022_043080 [Rubroshorea leprosula]